MFFDLCWCGIYKFRFRKPNRQFALFRTWSTWGLQDEDRCQDIHALAVTVFNDMLHILYIKVLFAVMSFIYTRNKDTALRNTWCNITNRWYQSQLAENDHKEMSLASCAGFPWPHIIVQLGWIFRPFSYSFYQSSASCNWTASLLQLASLSWAELLKNSLVRHSAYF